jgi:hypothetical protein
MVEAHSPPVEHDALISQQGDDARLHSEELIDRDDPLRRCRLIRHTDNQITGLTEPENPFGNPRNQLNILDMKRRLRSA